MLPRCPVEKVYLGEGCQRGILLDIKVNIIYLIRSYLELGKIIKISKKYKKVLESEMLLDIVKKLP